MVSGNQPRLKSRKEIDGAEHHPPVILYGPSIHQCIARGNLNEMEKTCGPGGAAPENYADVRAFLKLVKAEIAKLEGQK